MTFFSIHCFEFSGVSGLVPLTMHNHQLGCCQHSGPPNANAKSQRFSDATPQIAVPAGGTTQIAAPHGKSQLDTLHFGTKPAKSHWPFFSAPYIVALETAASLRRNCNSILSAGVFYESCAMSFLRMSPFPREPQRLGSPDIKHEQQQHV